MQSGYREGGAQTSGTRYVFAGTREREGLEGTKICPRCGEVLFADMDVCYGCLYDFARDERTRAKGEGQRQGLAAPAPSAEAVGTSPGEDLLASIELDEIDDEPLAPPRHRKELGSPADSPDDTLDLSGQVEADLTQVAAAARNAFCVIASSSDMQVRIPLPESGLSVGRGEGNDIVLRSRSVSRSHLRLVPAGDHVLAEDCGATNPAMVDGAPLDGVVDLEPGDVVSVCGTTFEVTDISPGPAA